MQAKCKVVNGKLHNEINGEEYSSGDVLKIQTDCGCTLVGEVHSVDDVVLHFDMECCDRVVGIELDDIRDVIPVRGVKM